MLPHARTGNMARMATRTYCTNCEMAHEASEAWCRAMCDEIRHNLRTAPAKSRVAKAVLAAVGPFNRPIK